MLNVQEFAIYQDVHSYLKIYPTQRKLITYNAAIKQRIAGYESQTPPKLRHGVLNNTSYDDILLDSIRRTKTRISDITLSNDFDLFVTFTFDPKRVDRTNVSLCKKKMHSWLKRQRERNGPFDYLIVPEFHKDGVAIHFHALIKNYTGKLKDSGIIQKKRKVYNITSYRLGHSTAVKIDNIHKVSTYIKKYITKDMPTFSNKKRYWCSKNLIRPLKYTNPDPYLHQIDDLIQNHDTFYNNNSFTCHIERDTINLLNYQETIYVKKPVPKSNNPEH
jgi:hypothetical protein